MTRYEARSHPSRDGAPLAIAVAGRKEGHVIPAMNPAVTWIAFSPQEARGMVAHFLRYANDVDVNE
jgi:hypothetical protein